MEEYDLEVQPNQGLGSIKVPRLYAQADIRIPERYRIEVKKKNGDVTYKSPITIIDEKIAGACIQLFQNSGLAKELDYKKLRLKAEETLEEKFKEYGLVVNEESEQAVEDIAKKREIAIAQWIRDYIEENFNLTFKVDFDAFISATGVKSAERIGNALTMLNEIQSKVAYEYKVERLSEDFQEIIYRFTSVFAIPKIEIDLDEEVGKDIKTIQQYIDSKIRNKKKHIKGLFITLSPSYLSAVLGLGRDYTTLYRQQSDKFTTTYAFRLDALIRSIEKVQHTKMNNFTLETFQKKMGTDFSEYKALKRAVIVPAIENINMFTDLDVELVEHKQSRKVVSISFSIRRKSKLLNKNQKFGINSVAYYIASRLFYFYNNKIENLLAYAKSIEKNMSTTLDLVIYGDKYFSEWEKEAKLALEIEKELLIFIEDNKRMFESRNIFYDDRRMCLVERKTTMKNPKEYDYKSVEKISIIKTINYKVTNPITSLQYVNEVLKKEAPQEYSIRDFLPFYINTASGIVYIKNMKLYAQYEELIKYELAKNNRDYFVLEDGVGEEVESLFAEKVLRGEFKEVTQEFRNMLNKLTKL